MDMKILHKQMQEWSKTHGPVISIYFGPKLMVAVNDIDTALEVLVKRGTDFASRPKTLITNEWWQFWLAVDALTDGGKDIAFGQYGPTWRLHRKLASKAFREYMQGLELEKRVHKAVNMTLEVIEKETEPFDPAIYSAMIVTNLLCGMCFGFSYALDDPEFKRLMEVDVEFQDYFLGIFLEDFIPGLQYWPTRKFKRLKELIFELVGVLIKGKYDTHKATFDRDNIRDFTDFLILARMEAEEDGNEAHLEQLTDMHLIHTLSDVFFAGIDTSRVTTNFALLHMVAYPEIQEKVQEELDRVLGEFDVPKGTDVLVNIWALHHDPLKWEDVDKFKPERYLDEEGKLGPKPESWLPFSAGRRVCLGETVAKPELHLIFASLMYKFNWRLAEGQTVDLTPNGSFGVQTPKPHKFIAERRN